MADSSSHYPEESYELLEIVEMRCERSMIFCTQYEPGWLETSRINSILKQSSPVSEAIMDRIVHNSYDIMYLTTSISIL